MAEGSGEYVQCVCGRIIKDASEYKLLFLKKEQNEIDILCPNDTCYLRELGFIQFKLEGDKPKVTKATFYSPFVTWNTARLGKEKAVNLLKQHLKDIVHKYIDWPKIVIEAKKQMEREAQRAREAEEAKAAEEAATGEAAEQGE